MLSSMYARKRENILIRHLDGCHPDHNLLFLWIISDVPYGNMFICKRSVHICKRRSQFYLVMPIQTMTHKE